MPSKQILVDKQSYWKGRNHCKIWLR